MGRGRSEAARRVRSTRGLPVLGVTCLVLMAAEKIMIDEVAHETVGGWTLQTEYILLYVMLGVQLVYNVLLGRALLGAHGR